MKEQGKEEGGPWEFYNADNFHGWEAERVVAVTNGYFLMEMITRAKTLLAVIIVEGDKKTKGYFQKAADKRLIEEMQLRAEGGESNNQGDDETNKSEGEIEENTFEYIEDTSEISCRSGCCIS